MMEVRFGVVRRGDVTPFKCGFCGFLVEQPLAHGGEPSQLFCQRIFCYSCVTDFQAGGGERNYFGEHREGRLLCPIVGCNQFFERPFFRLLNTHEFSHYQRIIIACGVCDGTNNFFEMNVERSFIQGDEALEYFFCKHCKLLAVEPRIHDGGYEQSNNFCKAVFCFSCTLSLQDFKTNKKITFDLKGTPHALCPAGCSKHFNPPFFRTLGPLESIHYDRIIIECPGCHQENNAKAFCLHRTVCIPLRSRQPWAASEVLGNLTSGNHFQVAAKRRWMEGYESKNRFLSNLPTVEEGFLTGDETSLKVYMAQGKNWIYKVVPFCSNKEQFLKNVKDAFGLSNVDGDILALNHISLKSFPDAKEFIEGLSTGTPLMFHEYKKSLTEAHKFGCWLFLEARKVTELEPVNMVSAAMAPSE